MGDIVERFYQYCFTADLQLRDFTAPENHPETWSLTKRYHSSRHPAEWLARGADFVRIVKDMLGIGKPITGRGQCAKLEGQIHKIWQKHAHVLAGVAAALAVSGLQVQR